jgi:hypothetical protein
VNEVVVDSVLFLGKIVVLVLHTSGTPVQSAKKYLVSGAPPVSSGALQLKAND